MKYNYTFELTPEEKAEVNSHIVQLIAILQPKLTNEAPADIKHMFHLGNKSLGSVSSCMDYMQKNPDLTQRYIDDIQVQKEYESLKSLLDLSESITPLLEMINQSKLLCGNECILDCNSYYGSIKRAAKANVDNAQTIYNDLAKRYPGRPSKKKEPGTDPAVEVS